ncbi:MAG: c-type cytochrome [Bellilinea sp.]
MKKFFFGGLLILIVSLSLGVLVQSGWAHSLNQQTDELVIQGGQLYDDWTKLIQPAPTLEGSHPIWGQQTTNTLSGVDTYRCVSCHGWDYQGADGAFRSGANFTGFPGIYDAREQDAAALEDALTGGLNQEHDFSSYLDDSDREALIAFIQNGLIDDNLYIDMVSLKVLNGDLENGKALYLAACAECHGDDGRLIQFRYEGQDINLGKLAIQDPWRFLHRTRFGTARAPEMVIGTELGWTAQDGRDVLLFSQTLPTGMEEQGGPSIGEQTPGTGEQPGGPASNIFTGILTALGAMATGLGFALVLGALLIGIIFLVVWFLRGRK